MEYLFIYLLYFVEIIKEVGFIVGASFFLFLVFLVFFSFGKLLNNEKDEVLDKIIKYLKKIVVITGILTILFGMIPDKKTILMLGGTYYGKKVYKNVMTDKKIQKINKIIELQLDKYIKQLESEV